MTAGPCYIKCLENAMCKIDNNVFMNHNCSITCADRIIIGDNVIMANNVVIVDHDNKLGHERKKDICPKNQNKEYGRSAEKVFSCI